VPANSYFRFMFSPGSGLAQMRDEEAPTRSPDSELTWNDQQSKT